MREGEKKQEGEGERKGRGRGERRENEIIAVRG